MPKRCAGAGLRGRSSAGQHDSGRLPGAQWPFTEKQNRKSPRVNILKGGNRAYPPGSIQSVGPAVKVRAARSGVGRPLPPAFRLTFCSGAALVPGAHLFPSPHGIVAVIGDENAGRAPANPRTDGAADARASPFHTNYFPRRSLPEEAKRLRKQAQGTLPGIERERLVRRARQLETASRMNEWLTSRGLQAPKQGQ